MVDLYMLNAHDKFFCVICIIIYMVFGCACCINIMIITYSFMYRVKIRLIAYNLYNSLLGLNCIQV